MTSFHELTNTEKIAIMSPWLGRAIKHVVLHPVQLTLRWSAPPNLEEEDASFWDDLVESLQEARGESGEGTSEYFDIYNNLRTSLRTEMSTWNWDTVLFPSITVLSARSEQTGDDDAHGGGCGGLFKESDFHWQAENPSGITLQQLTEAVYRLKGSKYDWWYELFSCIEKPRFVGSELSLVVRFGYGS